MHLFICWNQKKKTTPNTVKMLLDSVRTALTDAKIKYTIASAIIWSTEYNNTFKLLSSWIAAHYCEKQLLFFFNLLPFEMTFHRTCSFWTIDFDLANCFAWFVTILQFLRVRCDVVHAHLTRSTPYKCDLVILTCPLVTLLMFAAICWVVSKVGSRRSTGMALWRICAISLARAAFAWRAGAQVYPLRPTCLFAITIRTFVAKESAPALTYSFRLSRKGRNRVGSICTQSLLQLLVDEFLYIYTSITCFIALIVNFYCT